MLNASAGRGGGDGAATLAGELRKQFSADGREAQVVVASGAAIRTAAREAIREGCDVVVAGGGDGTISTVAAELVGTDVPLGVLPLGTLNHFARDLGVPLDREAAVATILEGSVTRVDVGEVNGRVFLNNSSLGVYPAVVRERERYENTGLGRWIAATWAALAVLRRHPFMAVRVTTDEGSIVRRTPFLLVGNNAYRMEGIRAATRASLAEGYLALYVMNAARRERLLWLALQVLLGRTRQIEELETLRVAEAFVETRRSHLRAALDGEIIMLETPLHYRTRPGALQVIVPAGAEPSPDRNAVSTA